MNRIAISFALMLALLASGAWAQPSAPACPSSTTLEELAKALDDAVSGAPDKDRACLRELMLPEARLTPIRKEQDGSFDPHILTVDDWINAVRGHAGAPFYEASDQGEIGDLRPLRSSLEHLRDPPYAGR